jgi:putative lipoprotein
LSGARLLAALLCLACAAPAAAQDDWLGRDKALHFGVSLAISASAYGVSALWLERPGWRALAGASTALAAGAAKELWDAAGHGDASGKDFAWDVVGSATGVGLALAVDFMVQRWGRRRAAAEPTIARAAPFALSSAAWRGRADAGARAGSRARRDAGYCPWLRLSSSSSSSDSSLSRSPISTTE